MKIGEISRHETEQIRRHKSINKLVRIHYPLCSTRNVPPQRHDWWAQLVMADLKRLGNGADYLSPYECLARQSGGSKAAQEGCKTSA